MPRRFTVPLLLALLAPLAIAQRSGEFYVSAGATTGRALDATLLVPAIAFGYGAQAGGLQAEVGAEYVRAARRKYPTGNNDFVARHGRLTASLVYGFPLSDRLVADAGLRAIAGLDVLTRKCGGASACEDAEGYSAAGPVAGLTATFGQVGLRVSGGYAWESVEEVYGGAWARVGLRYWP